MNFFFLLFKKKLLPFPHRLDELAEGICPQILSKMSAPVCFPVEKINGAKKINYSFH